jgi:hypothetical protein
MESALAYSDVICGEYVNSGSEIRLDVSLHTSITFVKEYSVTCAPIARQRVGRQVPA